MYEVRSTGTAWPQHSRGAGAGLRQAATSPRYREHVLTSAEGAIAAYLDLSARTTLAESTKAKYAAHLRRFAAWPDQNPEHDPELGLTDPWARETCDAGLA